ncbi:MAG: acetyl-CoA acetyltransferase [Deltaproteobacteria bacterium]|nr:acetyl-CoA acetyltransferase [Deltaproteobacteria bacterium]MBW2363088.1 acetyl-CoA acetyltransferase [Deltaproteobacteria bacterium]
MSGDCRPILVGAAQLIERDVEPEKALDPLAMLEQIAREAADDARGGDALLRAVDTIGIVEIAAWKPQNAARLLAERIGANAKTEIVSRTGGEISMSLVNRVAERILTGETEVALVAGTNNLLSLKRAHAAGAKLDWPMGGNGEPEFFGSKAPGSSDVEIRHGLDMPVSMYPSIENALRAKRGIGADEHRRRLGELFAPFTEVAARNPYARFPVARSADEIVRVTPQNRMVSYPYTKYMNAVLETDQAAGVLLMSTGKARSLGIPEDRWLYWWGGANVDEKAWFVSERPDIADSLAMRACAQRTLGDAGVSIGDVDVLDFYSCFPVAVELACEAYGVDERDPRGHTVTGGLPYAGGPGSNYPMHSLAAMAGVLRERSGAKGLVTGNGYYLTKHSASLWGCEPGGRALHPELPARVDEQAALQLIEVVESAEGAATVDTFTVNYDRESAPSRGIVIGRTADGRRFVANTPSDRETLEEFVASEAIGRRGEVRTEGDLNVFTPH